MAWSDYWSALTRRQRAAVAAGAALIAAFTIGLTLWLLHDPYVPLASGLSSERLNQLAHELDRAKLDYRIGDGGEAIAVPRSQLGKAHAAAAAGPFDVPPSVGLELFKEADFSTTDFAQKINYQRALQGELTRTIQTIEGVRSARVHVVLPDGGLFKRNLANPTAAVSVALQSGKVLTRAQVRGIQRLVAASVPEIKIDDVVVLDESGASLTRAAAESEGEVSSAQLDLKRQADQYLEGKLLRLLQELLPRGVATLSVDTTLDDRQLRVTTEEPIAVRGAKQAGHATGVLVKERQSQRGPGAGLVQTDGYASEANSTDWEYEYKVGNRLEQTLSAPGSIRRLSVAVALQGAPAELTVNAVEELVAHAVGIDRARGDSVAVMLLPNSGSVETDGRAPQTMAPMPPAANADDEQSSRHTDDEASTLPGTLQESTVALAVALALGLVALISAGLWWTRARRVAPLSDSDEDAIVAKVRQWLNEGASSARGA